MGKSMQSKVLTGTGRELQQGEGMAKHRSTKLIVSSLIYR
jgi:hypothetical protein